MKRQPSAPMTYGGFFCRRFGDTTNPPPPQVFHPAEKSLHEQPPPISRFCLPPPCSPMRPMPLLAGPNLRSLSWHPTATVKSREFIEVAQVYRIISQLPILWRIWNRFPCDGNVICCNNRKIRNRWGNNPFKKKSPSYISLDNILKFSMKPSISKPY